MKPKGLIIAVVLLAVLSGLVWWSNKRQAAKSTTDESVKLLSIPAEQFQSIRIKKLTGEVLELRKENDLWVMTQPRQLPADQDAVAPIVSTLSDLNASKLIEEKAADLQPFGLHIPTLDVTVTRKDGKSSELLIGAATLDDSGAYAKLAGDSRVFTVPGVTKSTLDKLPSELRAKRLLTFDPEKLTRLQLTTGSQTIEFGKNGQNEWQIIRPRPLRADSSQVNALVDKLREAKLDPIETEEDAAKTFASAARTAVAALTDASGTQTLELRKNKEGDYYAKAPGGVFKTSSDVGEALAKSLDDFRNKKLFEFGFSDPTKVEAQGTTYVKTGDKWMAGGKPMDNSTVQNLIDKLRDLSASRFSETGGGAPVFQAGVTSNDGKRVEKVVISKAGSRYLAKREGDPSIYELDANTVEEIQKAAAEVKPAPSEAAKK